MWQLYRQSFSENGVDASNGGFELLGCDSPGKTRRKLRVESITQTKYGHVTGTYAEKNNTRHFNDNNQYRNLTPNDPLAQP